MSRKPDAVMDVNTHLYNLRANVAPVHYGGERGGMRTGPEPTYRDTAAVKEVALEVVNQLFEES